MPELFIAKPLLHRMRSDRPGGWWDTFHPSILREEGGAVVLDTAHPAYTKAAREFGPLFQWHKTALASPAPGAAQPARAPSPRRDPRSLLWLELHRRPIDSPDLRQELRWLTAFAARVPCGDCRRHWKKLITQTPPNFEAWAAAPDGRASYARWTWAIHNAVNALIKKPAVSWEQASELHGWQSLCAIPPSVALTTERTGS